MQKEVVVKQDSNLPELSNWKPQAHSGADASDILIPKLLVMQGLSKMVVEDKAQMGDFVDSVSGELLGSAREKALKPVKIIPLRLWKTWLVFELDVASQKFKETVPHTIENDMWTREALDPATGKNLVRYKSINAFVLVADRIDYFPFQMTFKSTSYNAGKKLNTYFMQQDMLRLPAFYNVIDLTAKKLTNEKGTFYLYDFDLTKKEKASKEAILMADKWFGILQSKEIQVDQSDLKEEEVQQTVDGSRF